MPAGLSAILPGLGQLANRQTRLGVAFLLPVVGLLAIVGLMLQLGSPARLAATVIVPGTLVLVLALNGLLLLWRLTAVGQAFLDDRFRAPPTGRAWLGLALLMVFVAAPHALGNWIGMAAMDNFGRVFVPTPGQAAAPTGPGSTERLNVLLIGMDAAPGRTSVLTDTLMVASLDPIGETVSMVSIPRDLAGVPLGNGRVYEPKINSLLPYAESHPGEFPEGGIKAVQRAVGELLGIRIHYYAQVDMAGFVKMVDAVGGVDVVVRRALNDPRYDGFGGERGWSIEPGRHHLNGLDALAYARIRKSAGESDFTRAERQQQILVAIRNAAVRGENLVFRLPALIDAVGDTVRTDMPPDRLPQLAAMAEEIDGDRTVRIVIRSPLVTETTNQFGSVLVPDVPAIQAVASQAFGKPGVTPVPWPAPSGSPAASGAPARP